MRLLYMWGKIRHSGSQAYKKYKAPKVYMHVIFQEFYFIEFNFIGIRSFVVLFYLFPFSILHIYTLS